MRRSCVHGYVVGLWYCMLSSFSLCTAYISFVSIKNCRCAWGGSPFIITMKLVPFMLVLQADVQEISGEAYIVFGIILFFWELLPTSLVVVFFRVQRPNQTLVRLQHRSRL